MRGRRNLIVGRVRTTAAGLGRLQDEARAAANGSLETWLVDAGAEPAGYADLGERDVMLRTEPFAAVEAPPEVGLRDLFESLAAAVEGEALLTRIFGIPALKTTDQLVRDFRAHGHRFAGAERDGALVGAGRIRATAELGFLGGAAVAPEQRGRGVYRALVQLRVNWALERGSPFVAVHAREASGRVLRNLGFETVAALRTLQRGGAPAGR